MIDIRTGEPEPVVCFGNSDVYSTDVGKAGLRLHG